MARCDSHYYFLLWYQPLTIVCIDDLYAGSDTFSISITLRSPGYVVTRRIIHLRFISRATRGTLLLCPARSLFRTVGSSGSTDGNINIEAQPSSIPCHSSLHSTPKGGLYWRLLVGRVKG